MVELGVDKSSATAFPEPLMSTIQKLGAFLSRERAAAGEQLPARASASSEIHPNGAPAPV